ncbi:MAG: energy transducer TonB, partial [Pseudomonadota bacterium]|nr:energy transducer TonB [Pseudomonadota bacterium]
MFSNPLTRFLIGVPLALVMTLALFHLMRFFISADFEEPENLREYNLESITPEAQEEQVTRRARNKPRKLNNADKPPPPPKLTA